MMIPRNPNTPTIPRPGSDYRKVFDVFLYGPCTVVQIADQTGIAEPDLTRLLVEFRRRGLVERCGTVKGNRVWLAVYSITKAARAAVRAKNPTAEAA